MVLHVTQHGIASLVAVGGVMSGTSAAESQAVRRLSQVMRETSIDASGIARILDRDPKTVQRWLRQQTAPHWEVRELVLALNVVLERLSEIIDPYDRRGLVVHACTGL